MDKENPIILALDLPDAKAAITFLDSLDGLIKKVKIGPGLFIQEGPSLLEAVQARGCDIFLDLKLHDIPNTVALAVKGGKKAGVWMLSVHIAGGGEMIEAAVAAASGSPLLVGITVLTSLSSGRLPEIGINKSVEEQVRLLAALGRAKGLNGIVASPREARKLKEAFGEMLLITPGIRARGSASDDQSRTLTAVEALRAGADYLVVGRPILQAPDPRKFLQEMLLEIKEGAIR